MQEFELRVEPLDNNNFAIALCQRSYKKLEKNAVLNLNRLAKFKDTH
jgi:hypothetical protein